MDELAGVERALAEVVSLEDIAGDVLDRLRRLTGASGSTLFYFGSASLPASIGGSLAGVMQGYTEDLLQEDVLQSYALTFPSDTFLLRNRGDFAFDAHVRSRPYLDFYRHHDVGCVTALSPTGFTYGSDGMFGLLLCTPSLWQDFAPGVHRMLASVESPMRSAARRIARFSTLGRERDVLRQLVSLRRGAFVLWDHGRRLVWVSPAAEGVLCGKVPGDDLSSAAASAFNHLQRSRERAAGMAVLGRPQRLRSAGGREIVVEFSCVRTTHERPWLLADVRRAEGPQARLGTLTQAERGVLRLLVRGLSNREIAYQLSVSNETVRTHVSRVLRKLEVSSRAKAASAAREAWSGHAGE